MMLSSSVAVTSIAATATRRTAISRVFSFQSGGKSRRFATSSISATPRIGSQSSRRWPTSHPVNKSLGKFNLSTFRLPARQDFVAATAFRSFSSSQADTSPTRRFSSSSNTGTTIDDWSVYYRIEANNAARKDATQLTVSGPDIDGILASMTVALAVKGCSLVELHAAKSVDMGSSFHRFMDEEHVPMIHDVFYVVQRSTGTAFRDEDLEPLAKSLLDSLKTPMNLVGVGVGAPLGGSASAQPVLPSPPSISPEDDQIMIVKSTD
jgi:hypothetical protein